MGSAKARNKNLQGGREESEGKGAQRGREEE
jgi:hypothetical protein